jgi:hypothetical protein
MNTRTKNKNLTKIIFNLLVNDEALRDDWLSTIRMVHDIEMKNHSIIQQDYYYAIFFTDKLSNVTTVKRIWQLVQENCSAIRGKTWEERQMQGGMISKEMVFFDVKQLKMFDE